MDRSELSLMWQDLTDEMAPSVPTPVLRQLVAHQIQAKRYGGLKTSVRHELEKLASHALDGAAGPVKPRVPSLSPGTRLVREWNGQTILVEVLEEGFGYNDQSWNSLSEIARHVTGTHWSGPRFFGLHKHG